MEKLKDILSLSLFKENGGRGGFEGLAGVEKIERRDFTGELPRPEGKWRIVCIVDVGGDNTPTICRDDVILMKSEQSKVVGESKLV